MTTDTQREALRALTDVWALAPDMRLGQLMAFLGFLGEDQFDKGLGDIEDDELMAVLYRHKAELAARLADASPTVIPSRGDPASSPSEVVTKAS